MTFMLARQSSQNIKEVEEYKMLIKKLTLPKRFIKVIGLSIIFLLHKGNRHISHTSKESISIPKFDQIIQFIHSSNISLLGNVLKL